MGALLLFVGAFMFAYYGCRALSPPDPMAGFDKWLKDKQKAERRAARRA